MLVCSHGRAGTKRIYDIHVEYLFTWQICLFIPRLVAFFLITAQLLSVGLLIVLFTRLDFTIYVAI